MRCQAAAAFCMVDRWAALEKVRTSSASPSVLDADPKEMGRSTGGLSGMQSRPSLVWFASWNSVRGNVCVRKPACQQGTLGHIQCQ